jgi:hypothetical protein
VGEWTGIDVHLVPLLAKVKHLFAAQSEVGVRLVNGLSRRLRDPAAIRDLTAFLGGLAAGEHNAKRKIVYIRMLQGLVEALSRLPQQQSSPAAQELLLIVAHSLPKFSEEEEFNQLTAVLAPLLPLVKDASDQVARAVAPLLKSNNKFTLILATTVLAAVYKQPHITSLPAVREVWNSCKSLLQVWMKKAESSWQWLLPGLLFISEAEEGAMEHLSDSLPLFRVSCLALSLLERRTCLQLLVKYLSHLKAEEEEAEDHIYVVVALLLEEGRELADWNCVLQALSVEDVLRVASRGVFALRLFACCESRKNRGNAFHSLLLFIWQKLRQAALPLLPTRDFIALIVLFSPLKPAFALQLLPLSQLEVDSQLQHWIRATFVDRDEEEGLLSESERKRIDFIVSSLLNYRQ